MLAQLKKVLRTLCPPGHQPLLLECAVTRQQAEVTLVFAEAEAAQVMQNALHRQLVSLHPTSFSIPPMSVSSSSGLHAQSFKRYTEKITSCYELFRASTPHFPTSAPPLHCIRQWKYRSP